MLAAFIPPTNVSRVSTIVFQNQTHLQHMNASPADLVVNDKGGNFPSFLPHLSCHDEIGRKK